MLATNELWHAPGDVVLETTACDVHEALQHVLLDEWHQRFDVDAGRRQQRLAESGACAREWYHMSRRPQHVPRGSHYDFMCDTAGDASKDKFDLPDWKGQGAE